MMYHFSDRTTSRAHCGIRPCGDQQRKDNFTALVAPLDTAGRVLCLPSQPIFSSNLIRSPGDLRPYCLELLFFFSFSFTRHKASGAALHTGSYCLLHDEVIIILYKHNDCVITVCVLLDKDHLCISLTWYCEPLK